MENLNQLNDLPYPKDPSSPLNSKISIDLNNVNYYLKIGSIIVVLLLIGVLVVWGIVSVFGQAPALETQAEAQSYFYTGMFQGCVGMLISVDTPQGQIMQICNDLINTAVELQMFEQMDLQPAG